MASSSPLSSPITNRTSSTSRKKSDKLSYLRGAALTIPFVLYLFAADIALSSLLPLKFFFPGTVYNVSSTIAASVWSLVQQIFTRANGARIDISGDDPLPEGESAIVIANHVGWSDFYMIQALALRAGMLGRCRYFAKKQLRMVPFLGWGLWAMGMPMVSRNWLKDRAELDRVFARTVRGRFPICEHLAPLPVPSSLPSLDFHFQIQQLGT